MHKWRAFVLIHGMYFFQPERIIECGRYRWKWLAKFMAKVNAMYQDYFGFWDENYGINYYIERPKEQSCPNT